MALVISHSAGEDEACYCRPTPGVTQDIAGYKVKRFCVLWFITLESKERLKF